MTPLWNALDRTGQLLYVYAIHAPKNSIKGPYCHQKRTGKLYCLAGSVLLRMRNEQGQLVTATLRSDHPEILEGQEIPNKFEYTIEVLEDTILLNLCDYPWSEFEDEECTSI